ncbi:Peptidylprolyl isomerase OS=Stutzerimonas stutzeri OX=316 GN=CXK95_08985 PE=4 SV=1 [Stutzerimonas stutzeri]
MAWITSGRLSSSRSLLPLIRNGAELNFLRLLPAKSRQSTLDSWYEQGGQLKLLLAYTSLDTQTPSRLMLEPGDSKQTLARQLLTRLAPINAAPDPLNRCLGTHCYRADQPLPLQQAEQALSGLKQPHGRRLASRRPVTGGDVAAH